MCNNGYGPAFSPTISSNTLFHFTDKKSVIGILKEGFMPYLCMQDLNFILTDNPTEEFAEELHQAIPMVCFCDIPLSQSKNHLGRYGRYGIGLSKDWGMENNISPVLYAYSDPHKGSEITLVIQQMLIRLYEKSDLDNRLWDDIYRICCFAKQYKGKLWKKEEESFSDEINFYDEREWRYVPPCKELSNYCLKKREFLDKSQRDKINHKLEKMPLKFKASDIKYIIVSSEEEIISIIKEIEEIDGYKSDDKWLLFTKVISAKQIEEDF
jgi:hypothetical protein